MCGLINSTSLIETRILILLLLFAVISCVTSRNIHSANITIDRSQVPARYIFEINEAQDVLSKIYMDDSLLNEDNANSDLMFGMPIAVAIFFAVIFLVCCFCCLRCAVTYDGYKRHGYYGRSEKPNVVDIVRRFKSHEPIIISKN